MKDITIFLILFLSYIVPLFISLYIRMSFDNYFKELRNKTCSQEFYILYESWPKYKQNLYESYKDDSNELIYFLICTWPIVLPIYIIYKLIMLPQYLLNVFIKNKVNQDIKLLNYYKEINKDGEILNINQLKSEIKKEV